MTNENGIDSELKAFIKNVNHMHSQLEYLSKTNFIDLNSNQDPKYDNDLWSFKDSKSSYCKKILDINISSYNNDNFKNIENDNNSSYDSLCIWLQSMCDKYIDHYSSSFDSETLYSKLLDILQSDMSQIELNDSLISFLGYNDMDFIMDLMAKKDAFKLSANNVLSSQSVLNPLSSVNINTQEEKDNYKLQQKNRQKISNIDESSKSTPHLMTESEMEQIFLQNSLKARDTTDLKPASIQTQYPHVYRAPGSEGTILNTYGNKFSLPLGTTRIEEQYYEEIAVPPSKKSPVIPGNVGFIPLSSLDFLIQNTFKGYDSLNRIQSLVYEVAYTTNENMLICAPTGAGKTDVAMLTILHTINQFTSTISPSLSENENENDLNTNKNNFIVEKSEFKIIYIAPLKALASEIVEKFSKKLAWLQISVRELTGDMQLTKQEIMNTQIIVTTPEKWDVVTRKGTGDTELTQKVKLLIIDEVHLLHEERGAVIESIVARTLRQVESSQSMIRIIGLSATLPNYLDVADFLKVNPYIGLFFFDSSFRPVPLEQHFLGARGKVGSKQAMINTENIVYEKLREMLLQDHQVMIFVHSRNDTLRTARKILETAQKEGDLSLLDCSDNPQHKNVIKDIDRSKNKDIRDVLKNGIGIHHAGMLRSDRNLIERLFAQGHLKVLCCTATLAWGVNLPAAAVIIKGTQIYDSKKGGFTDMGVSDVIQIFGRAGRPQFEQYGIAFLVTSIDKLGHYVSAVMQQNPIESRFIERIVDNLNAEISLGTVTSIDEGIQWLGYTYLYVRMRKNPLSYGMTWKTVQDDLNLMEKRTQLIKNAALRLKQVQMITYDEKTGALYPKDTGRVASDFYLLNNSVEIFNAMMKSNATEADIFAMISMSGEFDNIRARPEETKELSNLKDNYSPCQIAGTSDTAHGKTNILLQAFISKANMREFSLISDSSYVAQNAARICRALFMVAMNRRWGLLARVLLSLCKSIDKRLWSFEHPLAQFDLPAQIIRNLEVKEHNSIRELREIEPAEMGELVHNRRYGSLIIKYLYNLPLISIETTIFPLTKSVLKISLSIRADFEWSDRFNGKAEYYWIWVEDSNSSEILHSEKLIFFKKFYKSTRTLEFAIPLSDPMPSQVVVRAISDTWADVETVNAISFQHLIRPELENIQTKLLNLQPLPTTALHNPFVELMYNEKFSFFNPMQTMVFHELYHKSSNVLIGSPTGSGKTIASEIAMWWAFREFPKSKVVYIAPMKALVRERVEDWKKLNKYVGRRLVELTGDTAPDAAEVKAADILITTPEKFDGISRNWRTRKFIQQVSLVIMDEIHLLASDRGPILEMIVSRMNYISNQTKRQVRLMGMSTAVANASDLASWLNVDDGLYNFPQSVRPVPLEMYIDGFPDDLGFGPLMKSMNKPVFLAIKSHSSSKPALVFVPSRRQTRLTAMDLINFCGMEDNPRTFLKMDENELSMILSQVKDETLKLSLQFGIGMHHAGLEDSDRRISHELFASNKIQILVATSTLAWGVNLPAYLVVIKGTQFFDAKIEAYKDMDLTDILQMMGRAGRPAFDTSGVAMIFTKESKKSFYKHFIHSGFPVESSLHKMLVDHIGAEISNKTIKTKQEALDFLTWTYLFRRIYKNPSYYGIEKSSIEDVNQWLINLVSNSLSELTESKCISPLSIDMVIRPTPYLHIASYYYISHKTVRNLLQKITPHAKFVDCMQWMCEANEYNELSVRHNEDLVNIELSKDVRYPGERMVGLPMWDPHIKAFLLVQSFISRLELPVSDYIQDTLSVLDQSLRILQCYVDISAEKRILSTTIKFISVMQSLKQAKWFDDPNPLCVLAGLEPKSYIKGEEETNEDKSNNDDLKIYSNFSELANLNDAGIEELGKKLKLATKQRNEFKNRIKNLPLGTFDCFWNNNENGKQNKVDLEDFATISITFKRKNYLSNKNFYIYAPKFPKPQKESWFVIVGIPEKDELLALKRLSPQPDSGMGVLKANLKVPREVYKQGTHLKVYFINDGMELMYEKGL